MSVIRTYEYGVAMAIRRGEDGVLVASDPTENGGYLIPEEAVLAIIESCKRNLEEFKGIDRAELNRQWIEQENARYEVEMDRLNKESIGAIKERTAARRNKPGFVYLVYDTIRGCTKIGYTENVKGRISQLKIANAGIEYLKHFDGTYDDEQNLHAHFKKIGKRISSEWFSLESSDYEYIETYFNQKRA